MNQEMNKNNNTLAKWQETVNRQQKRSCESGPTYRARCQSKKGKQGFDGRLLKKRSKK